MRGGPPCGGDDHRQPVLSTGAKPAPATYCYRAQQIDDFFQLDDDFHQKLAQIADCQLAWDTIENIKATIDRVRYMSLDHVSPPEMLLRQHHDIFSALENRDGNAVESAMTQHLQEISESVQLIRQENSGWFSEE